MVLIISPLLENCLKIVALWPDHFNIIGALIIALSPVTMMPFQLWNAFNLIGDAVVLMDNLSDMLTQVLILIKTCIMWNNKRKINDMLRSVLEDWNVKEIPQEWLIIAKVCRAFFAAVIAMYAAASAIYYLDWASSYIGKPTENRKLLLPSYYPFNYRRSPVYEGICMMQCSQTFLLIIADSVNQGLLVTLILHTCAQIELLNNDIYNYSSTFNIDNRDRIIQNINIKRIVKQHMKILKLIKNIDEVYSYASFFQISFSSIIICVTGYVIVTAMESSDLLLLAKFILFIFAMVLQVFTYCFIGQHLQNKGETITSTLCNCLWYNASPNEIKSLMFILSKAQAPLTLTGGRIFQLSINTFVKILKTSVSYLSVLRAVYN